MKQGQDKKITSSALASGTSSKLGLSPRSNEVLDRFYLRVLGFGYQVLGDAELAAQAAETVFVQAHPPTTELAVWKATMATMRAYVARGFVVRPLVPLAQGWQADVLAGLAALEPLDRALVLLRYHEGLDLVMLANVLDRTEADVRTQIAAVRTALLDHMDVA